MSKKRTKTNKTKKEVGDEFEEKVAELYRLMGYEVKQNVGVLGHQIDIILGYTMPGGIKAKTAVECKYVGEGNLQKNAAMDNINALADLKRNDEVQNLIIVTTNGFAKDLWDTTKTNKIQLLTFRELQHKMLNLEPYLDYIINLYEGDEISKYYVDLDAEKKENEKIETYKLVDEYINKWLTNEDKNHISILGEYGTGKTAFCRKYAHDLAIKYKNNKINRLPILINLRDYVTVNDLEELILEKFKRYDSNFNYSIFEKMNNNGEILLILDGLDEMSQKTGKDAHSSILHEIAKLVRPKSKVILTSRTEYFKSFKEEMKVLRSDEEPITFWDKPNFEILYLKLFSDEQIKEFLQKRVPLIKERKHDWEYYYGKIKDKHLYDLYGLSHRAVLLDMITITLPQLIKMGEKITVANLYDKYVEKELERKIELTLKIEKKDRRELMKGLAQYMFFNGISNVHHKKISDVKEIKSFFSDIEKKDIEAYFREFLVYSFLNRDGEGNYYFSHKSFMEFFCAKKFSDEIRNRNKSNFGRKLILEEIANFLGDLIREENYSDILFEFIDSTKGKTLKEDEKYVGGNAVSVLKLSGESFSGKDFSNTRLMNADFSNADLAGTKFSGAVLKNANLISTILTNADFSYANLEGAAFGGRVKVNSVFVTPDKKHIVSGSDDNTIKIWDFENGEVIRTLRGHNSVVQIVFVTPDRRYILSGSLDKTIKIWDFEKGEEIRTLKGHNNLVVSVFVTPDKKHIVSGSFDTTIKIWDFEKGEEIRTLKGHNGSVRSVFVTPDKKHIVSGSIDTTIKIWDFEKGEEIRTLKGHNGYVFSVFVTPDKKHIVSGSDDETIKIWDFETGECIRTISVYNGMNIKGAKGLSEDRIKFLKERGAVD